MGIRPGDTVFVAAIFSLYMGSWGTLAGAERLRAKAFPFGAGAPGMTARAAMWLDADEAAAFYGTPSFALHLAEVARAEGFDPRDVRPEDDVLLRRAGRVGAGRARPASRAAYGAQVIDCGSMAEMTPFMNVAGTAETDGMLLLAGHRLHRGLRSEDLPPRALRPARHAGLHAPRAHLAADDPARVSGDLTLWEDGPNPCGRTYPRLPQGVFGRIDDMFTIRGENVYPSEVDAVMNQLAGYGGEHRIVITRDGAMDELLVRVEAAAAVPTPATPAAAGAARRGRRARCRRCSGLRAKVEVVAPGTFPRTDFKARRVIDDREVFREMNQRLGAAGCGA